MATYWAYVTYVYIPYYGCRFPLVSRTYYLNHTHGKLTQHTDCVKINGVNGRNLGRLGPDNQAFVSATSSLDVWAGIPPTRQGICNRSVTIGWRTRPSPTKVEYRHSVITVTLTFSSPARLRNKHLSKSKAYTEKSKRNLLAGASDFLRSLSSKSRLAHRTSNAPSVAQYSSS